MAKLLDQSEHRLALTAAGQSFHQRGWMLGTAGNLSARDTSNISFWITASGKPKGQLEMDDFLRVAIGSGEIIESPVSTNKPSAETCIHQIIYHLFPEANACFHVHSVDACLATAGAAANATDLLLPPLEMIKGLGVWEQEPEVYLPLFPNVLDVPTIAHAIDERFSEIPPEIPALMIRDHGITVWGRSIQETYNRVELVEFLMSYIARQR